MPPGPNHFVGIDVGKRELAVAVRPAGPVFTVTNTAQGHAHLLRRIGPDPACIVLEATGRYHRPLHTTLITAGLPVTVINPSRLHGFRLSEGVQAKTDGLDAEILARFAEQKRPAPTPLPSPARVELGDWVRTRDFLVTQREAFTNRRAEMPPALWPGHDRVIALLAEQIAESDQQIAGIIASDPELARQASLVQSLKGVGAVTTAILLALLPELGQVSGKAIASLAGVAPRDDQSGTRSGKKRLRGGRARLRQALYMMALSTTRWEPVIKAHYEHLQRRGKPKKVALMACARRVLGILNAMIREGLTWHATKVGQGQFLPTPP
ncbi:MAG: transposase [Gemmatimonadales bacterium]|nr:transposase [Gemmatimonadales bacterium]